MDKKKELLNKLKSDYNLQSGSNIVKSDNSFKDRIRQNNDQELKDAINNMPTSNSDYKYLEEFDNAKSKILKYIMFKKRTEQEVRNKFQNEISSDLMDDIIEYLKEQKYIDDNDYIEKCVKDFMTLKKMSIKEIRFKLMAKGLKNDLIESYISSHFEELFDFEVQSVKAIFEKKNSKELDEIKRYLYSKGYMSETINYYLNNN